LTIGKQVNIPIVNLVPGASMGIRVEGVGDIAVRNDLSEREFTSVKAGGELNLAAQRVQ
jgi:hypothetical protein